MPTYQYRCTSCSTELEAFQKFTDDPLTDCPECDGSLRKVFNAVGVVFKGSGFYATDNRSKGRPSAGKAEKPADAQAEKPADAKPAAKPDAKPAASTGASSAA